MKTAKPNIKLLVYGFCLAAAMYNCKTKDVDSLTPFTYTFTTFGDVKLPVVTATAPAAVSVTASTVTSSTAAAAVSSALTGLSSSTVVPASVAKAGTDVSKAISATAAAQLTANFTPAVLNALTSGGAIPANLDAQLTALANNPALKAYLPTFTLPTVDGKAVGGRVGVITPENIIATVNTVNAALDDDACKAAASKAYNAALDNLKASLATQTAGINSTYSTAAAGVTAEAAPCKAGIPAKYAPLRAGAVKSYNDAVAILDANKATLGSLYDLLKVLYIVALNDAFDVYTLLETADITACDAAGAKKLANAAAARDKDLSKVNTNFNTAASTLTADLTKATASCHNQGNGG